MIWVPEFVMTLMTWQQSNARVDQLEHELNPEASLSDLGEARKATAAGKVAAETRLRPGITLGLMVFLSVLFWAAIIGFGLLVFHWFGKTF